jgi:hypothetical protein
MTPLPRLHAKDLLSLAAQAQSACADCQSLSCAGWESVGGGTDLSRLSKVGTLRDPALEEPTFVEHHPKGTRSGSSDAPIAPSWFPYNRCDVWRCSRCGSGFLRYTEYGGYYSDERIRALNPALVVDG